jgi:hypothetical protein
MNITKRTNEQIAEDLVTLDQDDLVNVILQCDDMVGDYRFTFSVIKSLIEDIKEEGDYTTKKQIWEEIEKANLFKKYE